MTKMYIARHNHVGRLILQAVSKGNLGGGLVMADVGSGDKCEVDGAPALRCNHVPATLLPAPHDATPEQRTQHAQILRSLKPDAMLVTPGAGKNDTTIHIVEIKCCPDTQPQEQLEKCRTQHSTLRQLLIQQGYKPEEIITVPILVGVSGTIYTEHTMQALEQQLGVGWQRTQKCANKLHVQAVKYLHSIVSTRRRLEHSGHAQRAYGKNVRPRPP